MKKTLTILASTAIGLGAIGAHASVAHAGDTLLGAQLQLLPGGEVDVEAEGSIPIGGGSASIAEGDLETAFGLQLGAEYAVHRNVTVGLVPRFLFNVKADEGNGDAGTQLDIPLRVTGRFLVAEKIVVYGFASVGYSLLFPDDWNENIDKPAGFIFGIGGGVAYPLSSNLAVVGELGYTGGAQHSSGEGTILTVPYDYDLEVSTSYPHIGIGVQTLL